MSPTSYQTADQRRRRAGNTACARVSGPATGDFAAHRRLERSFPRARCLARGRPRDPRAAAFAAEGADHHPPQPDRAPGRSHPRDHQGPAAGRGEHQLEHRGRGRLRVAHTGGALRCCRVPAVISFLGSEIGRGHPFYLDGLLRALDEAGRSDLIARHGDVFRVSRGLSLLAWQSVRASYRIAGRGGAVEALYRKVRGQVDYDGRSRLLDALGRDLRSWAGDEGLLVVDHPAVVGALGDRGDVWYLHGEHAAPPESIARRAARVFVPTEETAADFERGGVGRDRLIVTGICVEPSLAGGAAPAAKARRDRIRGDGPLTVAFFSSGAEPLNHVAALAAAAASSTAGHRALVFAERGGRLARAIAQLSRERRERIDLQLFSDRAEVDRLTTERFQRIDVVVSPPHERANWALALGVPFFLVGPDVGPFAPRNRSLLLASRVAEAISDVEQAKRFGAMLRERRRSAAIGYREASARELKRSDR